MVSRVKRLPVGWWVLLLTLPALVPLARAGFFDSHDGLLHIYRLSALDRAVRAGVLYPRWFPEFAFGYGHPVLNFYGPLSYYWGLPFTLLGADAFLAMKLVFATGLIASALGMYLLTRLHLGRVPALIAAVVYAYLPYHLVDLYVRGAVAEFLAFVWFPLVLWAFHRLVEVLAQSGASGQHGLDRIALASLLLAALVVTHSLSVFIFAPVLAVYVAILLLRERNRRAAIGVALALILGVAVSTFYWLPVLTEARYVGLGHGASPGHQKHLVTLADLFSLSPTYPYLDEPGVTPTFPLGLVQVAIIATAVVLALRLRHQRWAVAFFLVVGLSSAFMLTTASMPVWRVIPGLVFLQYPWRFQALTVLATAFLAGALFEAASRALRIEFHWLLVTGCLLAVGTWALWRLPVTPTTPDLSIEAMWQRDQDHGQVGATWTGEYLPVWVTEQRWAIGRPPLELAPSGVSSPPGQVRLTGVAHTRYDFTVDAPEGASVTLHQFHYPGWQAKWQSDTIPSQPEGVLALATFDLPPGNGSLTTRLGHTPAQLWGVLISLVSALVMGMALVAKYLLSRSRANLGSLLLAAAYLALAAVLLASLALSNGSVRATDPVNANLEETVELLAYTTDETRYHPGESITVTLYWRALRDIDQDYKAFVHLTDAAVTRQPAQHDGDPNGGFTPTTRWLPGQLVPDTHHLALPADLMPGSYRLWAGMYEYDPVRNLTVLSAETPSADNRVLLGEIEVLSP